MTLHELEPVLHALGFVVASAIYGMLLWTVGRAGWSRETRLPFVAGVLGLVWNIGRLRNSFPALGLPEAPELLDAVAYSALGFLPAVVVHAILRDEPGRGARMLTGAGYAIGGLAALAHVVSLTRDGFAPSPEGVHALGPAFGMLVIPLILVTHSQPTWRRTLSLFALAVFALTGTELAYHADGSLLFDLVGHHASMPLAFVILYQEYRFALADRFLKRALSFLALLVVALGGYAVIAGRFGTDLREPIVMGSVLVLWMGTAILYPSIARGVSRLVDRWLLGRDSYARLRARLVNTLESVQTSTEALDRVSEDLALTFNAERVRWLRVDGDGVALDRALAELSEAGMLASVGDGLWLDGRRSAAAVLVPTAESPRYLWSVTRLSEGRLLGTDDRIFLEWTALRVAQRIDQLRAVHERYEHQLREQEMERLKTQAELKALRAQLNPHFLFNALTTVGHLIESAPERAMGTLLSLTDLLRRVLRSNETWTSLGEEVDLVEAYLEIERARFEERLETRLEVPPELRSLRMPPLILQPLVENAIKHGISPLREGGRVSVSAERVDGAVRVSVWNTGHGGARSHVLASASGEGVGLRNVRDRLRGYFAEAASLSLREEEGATVVELVVPASGDVARRRSEEALALSQGRK